MSTSARKLSPVSFWLLVTATVLLTVVSAKVPIAAAESVDSFQIGATNRPSQDAVDVSSYQGSMNQGDFNKLPQRGVKSVIVKLTEGSSYTNPAAIKQMKYAANAGLNVNIYHYATFSTSGQASSEAKNLLSVLQNNGINKNIRIFADMESQSTYTVDIQSYLNKFWQTLSNSGYKNHGVYTSGTYQYRSAVINTVGQSKTWMAYYPYHPSSSNLLYSSYGAWQFSQSAKLSGYSGSLDVSHDYQGLFTGGAGSQPFTY
ncbi:hypothetical protein LFYK43_22280 [Ligilactobacillus salitolerans]|uniref:Lysozyme n=1 Tax=Ligilactobacillus salitolerans TaxID=1808352 RepID=A0A401IW78_9LACO|nr:GH25 family lysozyme [Ligilactobacillus salitolerans]GBG95769.1 hypothetical protein LFYK43_22280 [Ligilactobacillus salitolerans]